MIPNVLGPTRTAPSLPNGAPVFTVLAVTVPVTISRMLPELPTP